MSDSLVDRMKQDQKLEVHSAEKMIRLAAVVLISLVVFGGLYLAVRMIG